MQCRNKKIEDQEDLNTDEESENPQSGYITLDYKKKIVALADGHPNWSLATLQRRGANRLKSLKKLALWRKEIETGGTRLDKLQAISKETFDRFREARRNGQPVRTIF